MDRENDIRRYAPAFYRWRRQSNISRFCVDIMVLDRQCDFFDRSIAIDAGFGGGRRAMGAAAAMVAGVFLLSHC